MKTSFIYGNPAECDLPKITAIPNNLDDGLIIIEKLFLLRMEIMERLQEARLSVYSAENLFEALSFSFSKSPDVTLLSHIKHSDLFMTYQQEGKSHLINSGLPSSLDNNTFVIDKNLQIVFSFEKPYDSEKLVTELINRFRFLKAND